MVPLPSPKQSEPPIQAVPMTLFPTMSSLQEVVDLAHSKLPIQDGNAMHSILMIYHNTLLGLIKP